MTRTKVAAAAIPLLATKLHAPRPRAGLVRRQRLNDRLSGPRRWLPVLTLVSAPAGFGKTTLLAEWFSRLDDGKRLAAWLSLDSRDSDPTVFWSYVVAALRTVVPAIGESTLAMLASAPRPLEPIVAALVNDLAALGHDDDHDDDHYDDHHDDPDDDHGRDLVLVLDDYHVVESSEVQESVAFLLEHLPPRVHLVVAGRADPPLPLARLRARGELLEVRAGDLRFTGQEAAAYFNESMGLDLTARDVDVLEARTEGWIAALQLAALSLRDRDREDSAGFIANFTGDDRFVVDYLVEEVLERQPERVRSFLLQTVVLGRLTGPLCDAVTQGSGGRSMLEALDRANMFLVPLDDQRRWYRYHHLFADVLAARLVDEFPAEVDGLHRRASDWFEAHGERGEAIRHALAGHAFERAAELIERAAAMMGRTRQEATMRSWLEALPAEVFDDRPVLTMRLVGARMATGDPTAVEPLLQRVERWLESTESGSPPGPSPVVFDLDELRRLPVQLAVYRSALALLAGDLAGSVAHSHRALSLAEPSDRLPRGSAAALMGLALWARGELEQARVHYTDSVENLLVAGYVSDALGCSLALADIQIALGRLGDARATYESALQHAGRDGAMRGTADMHVGLCELHVERDELDAAERELQIVAALGEHAGLPQNAYRRRVAMARLLQARGDLVGALDLLDEAAPLYNTDFSPSVRPIAALRARVQVALGDLDGARQWAAASGLTTGDELAYVHEFSHITLARVLVAAHAAGRGGSDSIDDAIGLLDRLLVAASDGGRSGQVVEVLSVLAAAHQARGDRAAAVAALERAVALAAPERYVRVFVEVVPALGPLLSTLSLAGAVGEHLQGILRAVGPGVVGAGVVATGVVAPGVVIPRPPAGASPRRGELVDQLSNRELHVMRLLRSEMSGPEIARELMVSLNTMRSHTKSIYSKLGVSNRREAVRRAAELGL